LLKQIPNNYLDLIYCDVLYNTGKKFKDYDDNLGTPQEAIEWYKPRLIEMYRVLKDTGSIYLQMDCRLSHYIKIEMDKLFGNKNFKSEIIWKRRTNTVKAKTKNFSISNDNILFYTKSKKYTFNIQYKDYPKEYYERFKYEDERGKYRWQVMATYSEDRYNQYKKENRLRYSENAKYPEYKQYTWELKGIPIENIWDDINMINSMGNERLDYDTQKPKELLERIIKSSSNEGDIVADFFCGSGTTLVVAKELGRQYIGCDINQKAIGISKSRLIN